MRKMILALLVGMFAAVASEVEAAEGESSRAVALKCVIAVFEQRDPDAAIRLFAENAEWKDNGEGSAVEELRTLPTGGENPFQLQEIIFFRKGDVPSIQKRFPDHMWDASRIPSRLEGERLGCLVVLDIRGEGRGMIALVVGKEGDDYRIVYVDDN